MTPPVRFGVVHDFRCPPGSAHTMQDVYRETLEQVAMLDEAGLDMTWFSEHHFMDDGYLPSVVPVAGAVAAITKRMRISTDVALAPFQHPLRFAEDVAVLDQISNGRMEIGLGLAYAPHEFRAFGIPLKNRVSLTEEMVQILQLAWSGERFSFRGKRYQFDDVHITPHTVQPGGPPIWLATTSAASVARAVRFGVNVLPQGDASVVLDEWRAASLAAGQQPDDRRVGIIRSVLVTDDPERDWPPLRQAERYRVAVYAKLGEEAGPDSAGNLTGKERIPQRPIIGDVATCVEELTSFILDNGFTDVVSWGSAPGILPHSITPNLLRYTREVVPQVRARVEAARA
ncbi:MAG: LLM class flavin-dependent oxidoreductase [Actinobacteria bacterium]|nr:LLM class flavin-dependent oxidoreductase [Actinomycetota bacterium]MSY12617.1 LLM class flavin-dependent oxidoreductase [Actinomycetota bacterium]MSZ03719.1 LLM class flavin-dependent oxidoreductase [Actinomycetota bacterium]MTB07225.1 LLM class flavin-dependent oxidoreductase [Actinomycetota bacterium]